MSLPTKIAAIVLGLIIVGLLFVSAIRFLSNHAPQTPDEAVQAYVNAVGRQDAEQIRSLVLGGYDANAEIADRLNRLKQVNIQGTKWQVIDNPIAPYLKSVEITFITQGSVGSITTITDALDLQSNSGHWYILLGSYQPPK